MDRRYFEVVLLNNGCKTLLKPLYLTLIEDGNGGATDWSVNWEYSIIDPYKTSIGCLVIRSQFMQHTTLVFVDPQRMEVHWWDPFKLKVNDFIVDTLRSYFAKYGFTVFKQLTEEAPPVCNKGCIKSGFCNAYVLKYALDWHYGRKFNSSNIIEFVNGIEEDYQDLLPDGEPEVEFGPGDGMLLGGLGGVLVGGAVGGVGGALVGGATGALLGGALGNVRNYSRADAMCI